MTDRPPPDGDLDADLLAARAKRRRTFEVDGEAEALPDEVLGKLEARWAVRDRLDAGPDDAFGPAAGDAAEARAIAATDVSALVEAHLEARRGRGGAERRLALRERARAARAGDARGERLEAALASMGEAPRLAAARAALEDGQAARRLAALAKGVRALVPDAPTLGALAKEGARQAAMNTLNPALAASLAAADATKRVRILARWSTLPPEARVATVAALGADMADVLGAIAPPPTNAAAAAMGAGLALVAIAADPQGGKRGTATLPGPRTPARGQSGRPAAKPGRTAPLPPPAPSGPGLLAERRENLAHNVADRLQAMWARWLAPRSRRRPPHR
jgi:hypothetical protein